PLYDGDAESGREYLDRIAGDPLQDGLPGRRVQGPITNDEEVRPACLGREATLVEEERFVRAAGLCLLEGQEGIHVVAVSLRLGEHAVGVIPRQAHGPKREA